MEGGIDKAHVSTESSPDNALTALQPDLELGEVAPTEQPMVGNIIPMHRLRASPPVNPPTAPQPHPAPGKGAPAEKPMVGNFFSDA
jgi:hypothetical protein